MNIRRYSHDLFKFTKRKGEFEMAKTNKSNETEMKTNLYSVVDGNQLAKEVLITVQGLSAMSKEVKESVVGVDRDQLRFLVDAYNQAQQDRISKFNQVRAVKQGYDEGESPKNTFLEWLAMSRKNEELQIAKALEAYVKNDPVGKWITSITGVGPVLAAKFLAYFDIEKCTYAGQFLSYAGLNDYNNPWLGTEKANTVVNFVYNLDNAQKVVYSEIIKEICKNGGYSYNDFKEVSKILCEYSNQSWEWSYIIACSIDGVSDNDTITGSDIRTIDKLKKYSPMMRFIIDEYPKYRDRYQDRFSESINNIITLLKDEMVYIDMPNNDVIDVVTSSNEYDVVIDSDKILPRYLKPFYDLLTNVNIHETLGYTELSDWICSMYTPKYISNSIITNTASSTNRSLSSIKNGLINLKKKMSVDNKVLTKTDLCKYIAKPPYNKDLKVTCYLLGESFVKQCNKPKSLYGRLYNERKEWEQRNNRNLKYADQAVMALSTKSYNKGTVAYKSYAEGKLSDGHIAARAKRFAVKIFLVHLFECMYMNRYHKAPAKYYPLSHLDHRDYIEPETPYSDFITVPREYYDNYEDCEKVRTMKEFYDL